MLPLQRLMVLLCKTNEINALAESSERLRGVIAVKTAEQEDDFEDTNEDLEEIKKFLADLKVNCENTKKELAEYSNMMCNMMIGE